MGCRQIGFFAVGNNPFPKAGAIAKEGQGVLEKLQHQINNFTYLFYKPQLCIFRRAWSDFPRLRLGWLFQTFDYRLPTSNLFYAMI
jgi:hypothetical protein